MTTTRSISQVADDPRPGDVIELRESSEESYEVMLRVLAVLEDHVGYKEYGKGRFWIHKKGWKRRIDTAKVRHVLLSPEKPPPSDDWIKEACEEIALEWGYIEREAGEAAQVEQDAYAGHAETVRLLSAIIEKHYLESQE